MKTKTFILSSLFMMLFTAVHELLDYNETKLKSYAPNSNVEATEQLGQNDQILKIKLKNPEQLDVQQIESLLGRADLIISYNDTTSYFDESNYSEHFEVIATKIPINIIEVN